MAHTNLYSQSERDPYTAAMLSMVPGLGQFYNGESRKGILFLDVAVINFILLSIILLAPGISKFMQEFGTLYGMKINHAVIDAIKQMQFGTPVSLLVTGMVLSFGAYAARDAYDHAKARRRSAIYKDMVIELPEATSGSYILHASMIVTLAILALFFFIPQPPAKQVIEFQFMDSVKPPVVVKHKVEPIKSRNDLKEETKKFNPDKKVQKLPSHAELNKDHDEAKKNAAANNSKAAEQQHSANSSSSAAQNHLPTLHQTAQSHTEAVTKIASAAPTPTPLASLLKNFSSSNSVLPVASPTTANASAVQATASPRAISASAASLNVPTPIAMNPGSSNLPALPLPSMLSSGSMRSTGTAVTPMPAGTTAGMNHGVQLPGVAAPQLGGKIAGPSAIGTHGGPGGKSRSFDTGSIGPEAISRGDTTGGGPSVVPVDTHGRASKPGTDGDGESNGPAPVRAGSHGPSKYTSGPITLVPSMGRPVSGPSSDDSNIPGSKGKATTPPAGKDADFTKYMLDLQRRIKRAWFPPAHSERNRVKVMFKIHENGEMGNLRITESSGIAIVDQAALTAVRNASPFQHLPENAPENVDIEFTFDYNVFKSL